MTQDDWKETWDWADGVWGEDEEYGLNRFFGTVAAIYAKQEGLEEVGTSDVWHISFGAVCSARKAGVDSRENLMESVLDYQGVWGFEKTMLLARYAA